MPGPTGIASTGTSRVPFGPTTRAIAPAATRAGTLSAAGEPLHRLPPIEARPRTWIEPISLTPSTTPGQALFSAAWLMISMPGTAAPMRKPPFFGRDLPYFRDLLDVDQERGLDQVGFHLHDDIGAAGQYARRPGRAGQQSHCSLQRCRRLIPEIRH